MGFGSGDKVKDNEVAFGGDQQAGVIHPASGRDGAVKLPVSLRGAVVFIETVAKDIEPQEAAPLRVPECAFAKDAAGVGQGGASSHGVSSGGNGDNAAIDGKALSGDHGAGL